MRNFDALKVSFLITLLSGWLMAQTPSLYGAFALSSSGQLVSIGDGSILGTGMPKRTISIASGFFATSTGDESLSVTSQQVPILPPTTKFFLFRNSTASTTFEQLSSVKFYRLNYIKDYAQTSDKIDAWSEQNGFALPIGSGLPNDLSVSVKYSLTPLNSRETSVELIPNTPLPDGLYSAPPFGLFFIASNAADPIASPCYRVSPKQQNYSAEYYYTPNFAAC